MTNPGPNLFHYVAGHHSPMPNSEIVSRRTDRFICAKCGANSDHGDCGHNCRTLSVRT